MSRHVPEDRELLRNLTRALDSGDARAVDQAFEAIYNACAGSVAFVCARYLSDDTDIRSVTDDVFIRFFQRAPYIEEMRENIASALGVTLDRVNVKATTEEKLGFTGSGEGMAVHAVALLVKE